MIKHFLIGCCFILFTQLVEANPFCFARATSYYEQVYCELERKAQTKSIPPFEEFKKTSESVQYSLLKRIADKNYIDLPKPISNSSLSKSPAPEATEKKHIALETSAPEKTKSPQAALSKTNSSLSKAKLPQLDAQACQLNDQAIVCDAQIFHLLGNKSNQKLKAGVLSEDYLMALTNYSGQESLEAFLANAYNQYLAKMMDIGLGGVTMTYTKFVYFYHDIQTKKLNFSKRFETMYSYLKKDKAAMNASERMTYPKGLSLKDCDQFSPKLWACDVSGTNYLFLASSN